MNCDGTTVALDGRRCDIAAACDVYDQRLLLTCDDAGIWRRTLDCSQAARVCGRLSDGGTGCL